MRLFSLIFSRENCLAAALCALVIVLIILSANTAPIFIYQRF